MSERISFEKNSNKKERQIEGKYVNLNSLISWRLRKVKKKKAKMIKKDDRIIIFEIDSWVWLQNFR